MAVAELKYPEVTAQRIERAIGRHGGMTVSARGNRAWLGPSFEVSLVVHG